MVADGVGQGYKEVQEISPNLRYVIDELDQLCQRDRTEIDLKRKILTIYAIWKASSPIRSVKLKPIWKKTDAQINPPATGQLLALFPDSILNFCHP